MGFGDEEVSATFLTSHLTCIVSASLISVDVNLDHLVEVVLSAISFFLSAVEEAAIFQFPGSANCCASLKTVLTV